MFYFNVRALGIIGNKSLFFFLNNSDLMFCLAFIISLQCLANDGIFVIKKGCMHSDVVTCVWGKYIRL